MFIKIKDMVINISKIDYFFAWDMDNFEIFFSGSEEGIKVYCSEDEYLAFVTYLSLNEHYYEAK